MAQLHVNQHLNSIDCSFGFVLYFSSELQYNIFILTISVQQKCIIFHVYAFFLLCLLYYLFIIKTNSIPTPQICSKKKKKRKRKRKRIHLQRFVEFSTNWIKDRFQCEFSKGAFASQLHRKSICSIHVFRKYFYTFNAISRCTESTLRKVESKFVEYALRK